MEEKLVEAVRGGLERDGVLGKLRSEIRCEVLRLLGIHDLKKVSKPIITPEVDLINSLIGEYLQWIGYSYTSAIFSSESDFIYSRDENIHSRIMSELGLKDSSDDSLPLLCQLINKVKQNCNY
ncbi:centrosomal protein 20 [Halyomorpha halys]|uniref:centrosomal protein 20 n=1 Tax=Halyomorpha halys TaxID=286706 RepID=UPI0006D4E1A2